MGPVTPHGPRAACTQVKTIDSILERGANLDRLVEQSEDLSSRSKMFYKEAKRTNSSCCTIV